MNSVKSILACALTILASACCGGCDGNSDQKLLQGTWVVADWVCDTGNGPATFERNVGWQFKFAGDQLTIRQSDDFETTWIVTLDHASEPRTMVIRSQMDFDEDGTTDLDATRYCIYRIDDSDTITLMYGSMHTNVSLDSGQGESVGLAPTEFVPDAKASLVTLKRASDR